MWSLAIARALIKDPRVLLLDEATVTIEGLFSPREWYFSLSRVHWIRKVNVSFKTLWIVHRKDVPLLSSLIGYPRLSMRRKSLSSTKDRLLNKVVSISIWTSLMNTNYHSRKSSDVDGCPGCLLRFGASTEYTLEQADRCNTGGRGGRSERNAE